jgi:hypothetical protein
MILGMKLMKIMQRVVVKKVRSTPDCLLATVGGHFQEQVIIYVRDIFFK